MRWEGRRESENIEDRREDDSDTMMDGGGGRKGGGLMLGGGIGTLIIVLVVMLLGGDPKALLDMINQSGVPMQQQEQTQRHSGSASLSPADEKLKHMVGVILADTEEIWTEQFRAMGKTYVKPKLVLFTSQVRSGCGYANSQVGPFYCPADQTVYLDLSFYRELSQRFGAAGDFAQAYVVAHEIGHHVQKLLGISDKVDRARQRSSEAEANALSVRLELQADFLAGVWARKGDEKFGFLEKGDIEEAIRAANAIGDDTLQLQAQGRVVPDSFTHGSSAQRVKWFRKGYESGDIRQGDTFQARDL